MKRFILMIAASMAAGCLADGHIDINDTNGNGTDPEGKNLQIVVASPAGQQIAGLQFNFCHDPSGGAAEDCTSWIEPGRTVNWADHIVWGSDSATEGTLRFNVSFFLDESDIGADGALDGDDADAWLAEWNGSECRLTAEVWVELWDESHEGAGTVEFSPRSCSAVLDLDALQE